MRVAGMGVAPTHFTFAIILGSGGRFAVEKTVERGHGNESSLAGEFR